MTPRSAFWRNFTIGEKPIAPGFSYDNLFREFGMIIHYEKLETAVVMKDSWTVENGLITPTLKVKRNEVEKIHLPRYLQWYHKKGLVLWE